MHEWQEDRFERRRQLAGWALGPLVFVLLWFVPLSGLKPEAHRLLAILGLVVVLWMTEALPLAVTALLGPLLCVLAGIAPVRDVFKNFADPIIFLFLGSFLLAEAMLRHGLNRRIAFQILGSSLVGGSPFRLLCSFGIITAVISMWVSNTATTAMMFPIALAILQEMARHRSQAIGKEVHFTQLRYGTGLMLLTAFGASIGGLGTPVGTPPNLIGIGMIEKYLRVQISFFQWMTFGTVTALAMVLFLIFYLRWACPPDAGILEGNMDWLRAEKQKLGSLSRGERNVLVAFAVTIVLWLLPGFASLNGPGGKAVEAWFAQHLPESIAALTGGVLLFILPVDFQAGRFTLSWKEATGIDWGTILLFGGGLALGDLMFKTGLAEWMGQGLAHAFQANTTFGLVALFSLVAIIISEAASNTASATMIVPVAIAVAQAAGVPPLQPALAACLGASMGFMLPVSTPPNAVVFGSGCISLTQMVRHGIALDVVGWLIIVAVVHWIVPMVLRVN